MIQRRRSRGVDTANLEARLRKRDVDIEAAIEANKSAKAKLEEIEAAARAVEEARRKAAEEEEAMRQALMRGDSLPKVDTADGDAGEAASEDTDGPSEVSDAPVAGGEIV